MSEESDFSKKVANKLMIEMARGASESISAFSAWLLAGFSVAFGLILVNLEGAMRFVEKDAIREAFFLFLMSVVMAAIQKLLSSILQAGFQGADQAERVGAGLSQSGLTIDKEVLFTEIEKACLPPIRIFVNKKYDKLRNGDVTVAGRYQLKLAQFQGFFMLAQIIMAVLSMLHFISGIS